MTREQKINLVILSLAAIGVEGSDDLMADGIIGPVACRCLDAFVEGKF